MRQELYQISRKTGKLRVHRILVATLLVLAGCATPEYFAARDSCTVEWNSRLPAEYEILITTRHRMEEVPDGTETCTTEMVHDTSDPNRSVYTTQRTCAPNMKNVLVPYEVQHEVDIHKETRKARIRNCVAQRCIASHGNVSCKSDT